MPLSLIINLVGLSNKIFLGIMTLFVGILVSSSTMPTSFAATLTNVIVEPTNNIFNIEAHYVIGFKTGSAGAIKTIDLTFPSGFILTNAKLIEASGIGAGTISVAGQTITYTITTPVPVSAGTSIMIMLGKMGNNFTPSNSITITTKDASSVTIDGPTISPGFFLKPIGTGMIANGAVTNIRLANNSVNATQIISGSITDAQLSSVAAIAFAKLAVGLLPSGITVNSANIVDGSIVNDDLSDLAAIALSKLATGALPSGITINSTNIVDGSITSADMAPNSIHDPRFGIGTNQASFAHGRDCTLGEIILTAGTIANGIPANGQLLPINQNIALFSLLGSTYGGNGITTFALPDLRDVAPNGLTYSICITGIYPIQN